MPPSTRSWSRVRVRVTRRNSIPARSSHPDQTGEQRERPKPAKWERWGGPREPIWGYPSSSSFWERPLPPDAGRSPATGKKPSGFVQLSVRSECECMDDRRQLTHLSLEVLRASIERRQSCARSGCGQNRLRIASDLSPRIANAFVERLGHAFHNYFPLADVIDGPVVIRGPGRPSLPARSASTEKTNEPRIQIRAQPTCAPVAGGH